MPSALTYSSNDAAALLIAEIFALPYTSDLSLQPGTQLSLTTGEKTVGGLKEVIEGVLGLAGKEAEGFGKDSQKEEVVGWLGKVEKGVQGEIKALDEHLASRTYFSGNQLTAADVGVFASLRSYFASADRQTLLSHPSLTRLFDLLQHNPSITSALTKHKDVFGEVKLVEINLDDVPAVERKAAVEKKEKKKKLDAVAGDAAAAGSAEKTAPAVGGEKKAETGEKAVEGAEKKPKMEKKGKDKAGAEGGGGGKKPTPAPAVDTPPMPHMIDLRIGKIVSIEKHPDADSLYVEQIDFNEPTGPRTVVSGLVNYVPIEEMRDRLLVGVCNLKPASMRGVKSFAMVLCASPKEGKSKVELVDPPAGSVPGDRVYFEGFESSLPLDLLNPKKKIFETVQPNLTTLDTKECAWVDPTDGKVLKIVTAKGVVKAPTLVGAGLS